MEATNLNVQCAKSSSSSSCDEPQRKRQKRSIRFASDVSAEDPHLAGDSGFGGSVASPAAPEENENGDSFYDGECGPIIRELNEESNHPLSSIKATSPAVVNSLLLDTTVVEVPAHFPPTTDDDESQECKHPEESQSNLSSSSDPYSSSSSRSGSSNSNDNQEEEDGSSPLYEEDFLELVLNTKQVTENPARAAIMHKFLAHLRNNPHDEQLKQFLQYLFAGPEFNSRRRPRLRHVNTIQDAARLLRCSKRVLVLTGAGISVSCGIPDFRSKDGLYSRVAKVFPELKDPQSVFDIRLFRNDPRPFFLTAKELYPGQFQPSLSHKFIKMLETRGQLLRNYSQNIDTLETIAGIEKVTMCHGSFATATCIRCRHKVSSDEIKEKVLTGEIPYCKKCSTEEEVSQIKYPLAPKPNSSSNDENRPVEGSSGGTGRSAFDDDEDEEMYMMNDVSTPLAPVVKPDIVFFGEDLPDEFHQSLQEDKPLCDLVVVIGSSMRVRPVSLIPSMVPPEVPQILINRESLPNFQFDVELLGNCDHIIAQLCKMMGSDFSELSDGPELREIDKLPKSSTSSDENAEEIGDPKSEHDIQALKACWEPKTNEKLVDRLPDETYLHWRQRKYIFQGAEEFYDPSDEEEDADDDSSSQDSSSCSSLQPDETQTRDMEVDEMLQREQEDFQSQKASQEGEKIFNNKAAAATSSSSATVSSSVEANSSVIIEPEKSK